MTNQSAAVQEYRDNKLKNHSDIRVITFVDKPFDMHEHIWKRCDLFAVFEQLRQIVGNALRVDRVHFRHFHGNFVV